MITTKQKWITVAVFFFILLVSVGFMEGTDKVDQNKPEMLTVKELKQTTLGGMRAKMPDASVNIFFTSLFGVHFSDYRSYETWDMAVTALKRNQVQSLWASDVTAEWLLRTQEGIKLLEETKSTSERMQFALAFRPEDESMRNQCSSAILQWKEDGTLDALMNEFVREDPGQAVYSDAMVVNSATFSPQITGEPVYIGITGSVPPLECVDAFGEPYGFCVKLSDLIGQSLKREVRLLVLDNETIFTELMTGRVDIVFCYGTSENHSTEFPPYLMSEGYCPMYGYRLLVAE